MEHDFRRGLHGLNQLEKNEFYGPIHQVTEP